MPRLQVQGRVVCKHCRITKSSFIKICNLYAHTIFNFITRNSTNSSQLVVIHKKDKTIYLVRNQRETGHGTSILLGHHVINIGWLPPIVELPCGQGSRKVVEISGILYAVPFLGCCFAAFNALRKYLKRSHIDI